MESALVKRPVQSTVFSMQEGENAIDQYHRLLCLLTHKVEKYFCSLDELEKLCKQVQEELETCKLQMREKYDIIEENAERKKLKFICTLLEMKKKIRRMKRENAARSVKEQNALRITASARLYRFIKIPCALVFYSVATYGLLKLTQLFL